VPQHQAGYQKPYISREEIFMDIWYELAEDNFMQAYEACKEVAKDMIQWLHTTDPELHDLVHKRTEVRFKNLSKPMRGTDWRFGN